MAIRLLPETTVNRIAAGEVVERPAAVVKELVENALDAGATRIAVTLEGGGIERIVVDDDGSGMGAGRPRAGGASATPPRSCRTTMLFRIATLGFRGEALPSIGAVARLAITSRPRGRARRASVRIARRGRPQGRRWPPAAGAPGTRVEVRDLFYAIPARRKFLKTPRTEAEAAMRGGAPPGAGLARLRLPRAEATAARCCRPAAAGPRCPHRTPCSAPISPRPPCRSRPRAAGCCSRASPPSRPIRGPPAPSSIWWSTAGRSPTRCCAPRCASPIAT